MLPLVAPTPPPPKREAGPLGGHAVLLRRRACFTIAGSAASSSSSITVAGSADARGPKGNWRPRLPKGTVGLAGTPPAAEADLGGDEKK